MTKNITNNCCDLTYFTCPMNLVVAKNFFFNASENNVFQFILKTENKAGINNIINFLKFKNANQIKVINSDEQKITQIFFTKTLQNNTHDDINSDANNNIQNCQQTKPSKPANINAEKKLGLAKQLQQNIRRRKS